MKLSLGELDLDEIQMATLEAFARVNNVSIEAAITMLAERQLAELVERLKTPVREIQKH